MSYLHRKNLLKFEPLPSHVVARYIEEGRDALNIDEGHARLICGFTNLPPEADLLGRSSNTPVVPPEHQKPTTSTGALHALAQQVLRGYKPKSDDLELIRLILKWAEEPQSVVPADETRLKEISDRQLFKVCPIRECSKRFRRRDDLVKHIRKPSGDAPSLRRHHELDVKYQGMELICCGETHTNFGVLVKHMKSHRGT